MSLRRYTRESTDLANIRSAYAEVSAAAITDPDNDHNATVNLKQTQDNWQTEGAEVAGISVAASTWGVTKGGTIDVEYAADTDGSGVVTIGGIEVASSFMND